MTSPSPVRIRLATYYIFQAGRRQREGREKEEAAVWAARCPASDNEVIKVRQVHEFADFPADVKKAAAGLPEMQAQSGKGGGS